MKLRISLVSAVVLALVGAVAYTLTQRERGDSSSPASPPSPPSQPAEQAPEADAGKSEAPVSEEEKPALPAPQPESTTVPLPPQPMPVSSALPDVDYGTPGVGHEPEKYPQEFAAFCEKLDEQVRLNEYDYCPSIQVLLAATDDEFAIESWMQAAADIGNAAAIHYLADLQLAYVPANELQSARVKKACAMLRKAADMGFDASRCSLSECLRNGLGTKKDEAAAKRMLIDACKSGRFIPRLRWLITDGRLKSYEDRERKEVKSEMERGNHHVIYYMSRLAPDSATQFSLLRKAAELGNAEAFHDLAVVNFKTKPRESYELLKAAARLRSRDALYLLGSSLLEESSEDSLVKALGLKPDERTAMRLIKTAAAMRAPRAVYFMGRSYYSGLHGMPQDKALAYRHFSRALALRAPDSGAAMGLMLLRGEGVQKDIKQGLRMITLAANSGYAYAIVLMAYAHYNGLGVPANMAKASEFLQEAAALGQSEAYVYLAFITARGGAGRAPDAVRAESYLRMASVDLREKARELYKKLEDAGTWEPLP